MYLIAGGSFALCTESIGACLGNVGMNVGTDLC